MKKILIALPNDSLGGAEQFLKMIANYYIDKGCIVYVLFLKKERDNGWRDLKSKDNVHLLFTGASSEKRGLMPFLKQLGSLRDIHFDYVYTSHLHLTGTVGFFIKLGIIKTKYFVGRESTLVFSRFKGIKLFLFKILYRIGYSALDLLICQTGLMKEQFIESLPRIAKKIKIFVIPNPIRLAKKVEQKSLQTIKYNNYIVSAGRLIPEKGFDILISVFSKLHKHFPDLKLVILGEGKDRKALEQQIEDLKMKDHIFLEGFVENVYPYFNAARLCVVSSRIEGFPNVLLQMMSENPNVVATKCAGDIDKIPGIYLSEINDEEDLLRAMTSCLNNCNKENEIQFDTFLRERSIENFVNNVNQYLQNEA